MTTPIDHVQILRDAGGHPAFAVLPYAEYQALKQGHSKAEAYIPNTVVNAMFDQGWTAVRAWREHLGLTQAQVAERLGISQPAFAQQEASPRLRKASRDKIAAVLGITSQQLTV